VRSVAELEHVDANVQVRPVQQGQAAAQRAAQAARAEFSGQETSRKALHHSK